MIFLVHPEASIGALEKGLFECLELPSIRISQKISFNENCGNIYSKTSISESIIQVYMQAFLVCEIPLTLKSSRPF